MLYTAHASDEERDDASRGKHEEIQAYVPLEPGVLAQYLCKTL